MSCAKIYGNICPPISKPRNDARLIRVQSKSNRRSFAAQKMPLIEGNIQRIIVSLSTRRPQFAPFLSAISFGKNNGFNARRKISVATGCFNSASFSIFNGTIRVLRSSPKRSFWTRFTDFIVMNHVRVAPVSGTLDGEVVIKSFASVTCVT